MIATLLRNPRLALALLAACGTAGATPKSVPPSPTPFRVLTDAQGFDFPALSGKAIGPGTTAEIFSQSPGRVLVGVFHGACDHFSVDATRPGEMVLTVTKIVPKGVRFCSTVGIGSVLEVETPKDGGLYTLHVIDATPTKPSLSTSTTSPSK